FALEMGEERILSVAGEPPAFSLHLWMADAGVGEPGLVTHTIPIGDWGKPLPLLRKGKRILSAA
ncbi:MAG: phosphodiesterase, partial [Pseudomonadota bacterium]|nr:phosphodiesterase [Pseudomonadota bacterium]